MLVSSLWLAVPVSDSIHWRRNRGGGGGTGARAPLNFGYRGQDPPKFWGYSVKDC